MEEINIYLSADGNEIHDTVPSTAKNGPKQLVTPGTFITSGYMRGHGTFNEEDRLYASVAGSVQKLNKLVCVAPVKQRYTGDVGDVVVGRISDVGQKRWRVYTNSRTDSVLHLASVNLPGGELRRKSEEDEAMMRTYLQEGDLISAEVQKTYPDGSLSLHTRNLRYGKLGQGVLVRVPSSLVKRRKTHFHNLPFGASVILGCNGLIWISTTATEDEENTGGFIQNLEPVPVEDRHSIARLQNCIRILAEHLVLLYDTTVVNAFNFSLPYQVKEMLRPEIRKEIAERVRAQIIDERDLA